jgi:hypothetical protein
MRSTTRRRMAEASDEIIEQLRTIEERLRDLAYDSLREAAAGDDDAKAAEKKLNQARRAVERAIKALGGVGDGWD